MSLDNTNNDFYNTFLDHIDGIPFKEILPPLLLKYLSKPHQKILEIGSGPGALALWLTNLGHELTCIEPAEKAAQKAIQRGLNVSITRIQDFQTDQQFDAILAISSLIHLPKSEIESQIKKIATLIHKDGIVVLSFIEGQGECYEDPTNKGKTRYFSKYSEKALNDMLSSYFHFLERHQIMSQKMGQFFLLFVLKPTKFEKY